MKEAIIALIKKWACLHKWEEFQRMNSYTTPEKIGLPRYVDVTLICQKCGKIKKISL